MKWSQKNLFGNDVHFASDRDQDHAINDFALLISCNHTIMTIGSFGYMAAYLTNGETVYFATLIYKAYNNYFHMETAFPPYWIGVKANGSIVRAGTGPDLT